MSSGLGPTNIVPILFPSQGVAAAEEVTLKAVKLTVSNELGFQAFVVCRETNGQSQQVAAQVTSNFTPVKHFYEKIRSVGQKNAERIFLESIDIKIERQIGGGFRVILGPKESIPQVSAIRSTAILAEQMTTLSLQDSHYSSLQALALSVIEVFAQTQVKTKSLIEEVSLLALAHNSIVTKQLIKVLVREVKQGELLDIDLLKALKTNLVNSFIDALDPDDLIQILKVQFDTISRIHKQRDTGKLAVVLSLTSDILDVMGDANVMKVDRIELHKPLYELLDSLSEEDDLIIASQATYAKQALVRLPDDESSFRSAFRHGKALLEGFSSLSKVLLDQDILEIFNAYDSFKEAIEFNNRKKGWYGDVRILKILKEKGHFKNITLLLEKNIKYDPKKDSHVVGNLLVIAYEVAHHHPEIEAKKWALDLMGDLFLNDIRSGKEKKMKKKILEVILNCASIPNPEIFAYVKDLLKLLDQKASTKEQRVIIDADVPDDLDSKKAKAFHYVENASNTLITTALRSVSLDQKIEQMKDKFFQDQYLKKELEAYIPVRASHALFDPKEKPFDLDEEISRFLNGNNSVFLLLGDSGAGKSTYLRFLEQRLWENWNPQMAIPLFISLPVLASPFQEAIQETLKKLGFNAQERKELQGNYRFLFLVDGYDELKQRDNFYTSNRLNEWKGKMIISCRTQYLMGDQSSYKNFFLPKTNNLYNSESLDEAAVSPFSSNQIEAYFKKYIQLHESPYTWDDYQKDIASVSGLNEMIESPFLLRIIAEVLPSIMIKHREDHGTEALKLLRKDIFEAFINNWFHREEQRIINAHQWNEPVDIKKLFESFAIQLAQAMYEEDKVAVEYEEELALFNSVKSKWEPFFGNSSPRISIIRSGIPLRKLGPTTYAFIHKSVLEFFQFSIITKTVSKLNLQSNSSSVSSGLLQSSPTNIQIGSNTEHQLKSLSSHPPARKPPPRPQSPPLSPRIPTNPSSYEVKSNSELSTRSPSPPIFSLSSAMPSHPVPPLSLHNPDSITSGNNFSSSYDFLNKKLLTSEPEIIRLAAEAVTKDPVLKDRFFDYLTLSKTDSSASIAAANAITILNAAGVSFSYMDLSKIRIPGANLSKAILYKARLDEADLRNVKFYDANLYLATLTKSTMEGADFGCKPTLKLQDSILALSMFHDGLRMITITGDEYAEDVKIQIWDLQKRKVISTLNELNCVRLVTVFPDGTRALFAYNPLDEEPKIILWDLVKNAQLKTFVGHRDFIQCLAVSKTGNKVLSGSSDRTVRLWDISSGTEIRRMKLSSQVNTVDITPDGRYGISGGEDSSVSYWDLDKGRELHCFREHDQGINAVAISSDGKKALSGGSDEIIRLWDLVSLSQIGYYKGHSGAITSLVFSPDNKTFVSGSKDQTVRKWDLNSEKEITCWQGHMSDIIINSICHTQDEKWVISASNDAVHMWDNTKKEIYRFKQLNRTFEAYTLSFSQSGQYFMFDSLGDTILYNFVAGTSQKLSFNEVGAVKISSYFIENEDKFPKAIFPDGKKLLRSNRDLFKNTWLIEQWDIASGKKEKTLQIPLVAKEVTDNVEKLRFYFSSKQEIVLCIIDYQKGHKVFTLDLVEDTLKVLEIPHSNIKSLAFSADNKELITGHKNGQIHLWDFSSGKKILSLKGHAESVNGVALVKNGLMAISGSSDGNLRIWDLESRRKNESIKIHKNDVVLEVDTSGINCLQISPNEQIVLLGTNNLIKVFDLAKREEVYAFSSNALISKIHFAPDGNQFFSIDEYPSIKLWRIHGQAGDFKPALLWGSASGLDLFDLQYDEVIGLSENNRLLIEENNSPEVEEVDENHFDEFPHLNEKKKNEEKKDKF